MSFSNKEMLFLIAYFLNKPLYGSIFNSIQAVIIGYIADHGYENLAYFNCISVLLYMICEIIISFWRPEVLNTKEMFMHHLFTIIQILICLSNNVETMYCSRLTYILEFTTIFYFLHSHTTDKKIKDIIGLIFIIIFYIVRFPIFTYYVYEYYQDINAIGLLLPLMPVPYILNIYWAYLMFLKVCRTINKNKQINK